MATQMQKEVFNKMITKLANKEKVSISALMKEAGFSEGYSHNPTDLTQSKGWKELLAQIEDGPFLDKLKEIALSDDKRAAIESIKEIFKLKDRYPATKIKGSQYDEELNSL